MSIKKKFRLKRVKRNLMMNSVRDLPRINYIYRYASVADCIKLKYDDNSSDIVSKCADAELKRLLYKGKIPKPIIIVRKKKNKRGY